MATTRLLRQRTAPIPSFLAPSIFTTVITHQAAYQSSAFSTSTSRQKKDNNKKRGVSALRRTGPKHALSVSKDPLPQPVLDPAKRSKISVKEDHGLWQFFTKDKKPMVEPDVESSHGRAWTVEELREKSFEDLHALWWVCVKERNRILTQETERRRMKAGFGEAEAEGRSEEVRQTQKAIKHALTERWYAYMEATEHYKQEGDDIADEYYEEEEEEVAEALKDSEDLEKASTKPLAA